MATIQDFEELKVWQNTRTLCQYIYDIIQTESFSKDYQLKQQINGSSGSIMDNIAEGFGRNGTMEFINFLYIANGSAKETKSQIYRAFDRKYISEEKQTSIINLIDEIGKMLYSLICYLDKSDFRGPKFRSRDQSNQSKKIVLTANKEAKF